MREVTGSTNIPVRIPVTKFAKDGTFIREAQNYEMNGHLHILATSDGRIPMKEIAAQWGHRVDFRQPKKANDVLRYLRGYLVKCNTEGVNMRPFGDIHRSRALSKPQPLISWGLEYLPAPAAPNGQGLVKDENNIFVEYTHAFETSAMIQTLVQDGESPKVHQVSGSKLLIQQMPKHLPFT